MKINIFFLYTSLLSFFLVLSCERTSTQELSLTLEEKAKKALETFKELITEDTYDQLGFKTVSEKTQIALGERIPFYHIGFDQIQNFEKDHNPNDLLNHQAEYFFPVLVEDSIRSSISFKNYDGIWKTAQYGRSNFTKAIAIVRAEQAKEHQKGHDEYFAIHIPALYLIFISHFEEDVLMMRPVYEDDRIGLISSETLPATEALSQVSEYADIHKGGLKKIE